MKLLLLTLALSFTLPAFAAPKRDLSSLSCPELYALTAKELAGVKPDFLAQHNADYTLEVASTAPRNQCQYGSCWIYNTLGEVESQVLREKGVKVDLSEPYLILKSLEERIDLALATPGKQIAEGGHSDVADRLLDTYGTVPTEVWKPRVPFEEDPHRKRLLSFLQNRMGRFHVETAAHPEKKAQLLKAAKADLHALLEAYMGKPPKAFTYQDVRYSSPLDFSKKFLPPREEPVLLTPKREEIAADLAKVKPSSGSNTPLGARGKKSDLTVSMERFEKTIVDSLKKGHAVRINAEMANEFIDRATGIMSTHAFYTPPGFEPAPYTYRQAFKINGGGHAMMIVGADLDESGKVIKFKVKNSWGEKSGDQGFYHMYVDYFREYVYGAYIR